MKKCPYCAEEIQDEAIKCKHCGEFLEKRMDNKTAPIDRGTDLARAVSKGIKQKELEENNLKITGALLLIGAIFLGYYTNFLDRTY